MKTVSSGMIITEGVDEEKLKQQISRNKFKKQIILAFTPLFLIGLSLIAFGLYIRYFF